MGQSEFRFLELTNIPFSKETKYKINHICRGDHRTETWEEDVTAKFSVCELPKHVRIISFMCYSLGKMEYSLY